MEALLTLVAEDDVPDTVESRTEKDMKGANNDEQTSSDWLWFKMLHQTSIWLRKLNNIIVVAEEAAQVK